MRGFMKHHVFAVWDFFTLLKRLQSEVTTVSLPWRPAGQAEQGRFVLEIVLAEETDQDVGGGAISTLVLSVGARAQPGPDPEPITAFLAALESGIDPMVALEHPSIPA